MIIYNAIACLRCLDVIESIHVHDLKYCRCGKIAIDGGLSYLQRLGDKDDHMDLSMDSKDGYSFETVRQFAFRTGYGKPGSVDYGLARKTILKDMNDDHLEASLVYVGVNKGSYHWQLLLEEKLYRSEHEISIADA